MRNRRPGSRSRAQDTELLKKVYRQFDTDIGASREEFFANPAKHLRALGRHLSVEPVVATRGDTGNDPAERDERDERKDQNDE